MKVCDVFVVLYVCMKVCDVFVVCLYEGMYVCMSV